MSALPSDGSPRFHLIIIGAGINGSGIARDAALCGLRVLLLDKGNVASGATSQSTRLNHGGLRCLEQLEFGLVRESLRERLLHIAPHLVCPLPYSPHETEASVTRRHIVRDRGAYGGPDGLISIVGGKLTPYRELAEQASTSYCAGWVVPQPARAQRTSHSLARERASPGKVSRVRGRHL